MNFVRQSRSFLVGIFAFAMLSSVALADTATSATSDAGEKLMAQAERATDRSDMGEAIKYYVQAAELNQIPAQVKLGEYAEAAQYYNEAVGWYLMAAMQGDAAGQYNLGRMYQSGNGIEKDDAKASYWIRRSAAKNYQPAAVTLANAYRVGTMGVKVDKDLADSWEKKAARLLEIENRAVSKKLEQLEVDKKKLQEEAKNKGSK